MYLSILGASLLVVQALGTEELRLGGPGGWSAWKLPGDAVAIADGVLKPAFVRQNIDAVQNAALFGGGIRAAGTALNRAARLIDGNVETAWTPAAEAPLKDWWIVASKPTGRPLVPNSVSCRWRAWATICPSAHASAAVRSTCIA